jgi:hypothetical protein
MKAAEEAELKALRAEKQESIKFFQPIKTWFSKLASLVQCADVTQV